MKKIILLFLMVLYSVIVNAQTNPIDSLKQLIQNEKQDTSRALLLFQLSRQYNFSKPDSALLFARQAVELSRKINFKKGEATGLRGIAAFFANTGNYPASLEINLQALKISEEIHDERTIAILLRAISDVYFYQGDNQRSIDYARRAIDADRKLNDSVLLRHTISSLADTYEKANLLDSALFYARLSYKIITIQNNKEDLGIPLNNLGNVLRKLGETDSALMYYRLAIPYLKQTNNDDGLCELYMGLAHIFSQRNNIDSSLYYAKLSYTIGKQEGFIDKVLVASNFLSAYYKSVRNVDSAYAYQEATIAAKDSLFSQQKANQIQSMTYDEAIRQQQIEDAKEQERIQAKQNALIGGIVVLLLVASLLTWNNRQRKKANKLLRNQKDEIHSALTQLKATQTQLIHSEKMASLGELTAGIAHEIQNPLNFVNNFSEVSNELIDEMKDELSKSNYEDVNAIADDVKQNLEKINHHGKRADAIVKGMLQHSRTSSGQKELTDINALCDEYLRLSYHGLRAKDKLFNAEFKTDFDVSIGKIKIVPQDIGRVLLNLINNAFYAVNEKKKTANESYEPLVTVITKKAGDKISISVKDNGNGIPSSIKEKIFQPFFTTKPTGKGTGLGLSLSYDIIKAHGGETKVETKDGEGSEFTIVLPT